MEALATAGEDQLGDGQLSLPPRRPGAVHGPAGRSQRTELPELLTDSDHNVAVTAAIATGSPGRCESRSPTDRRHRRRRTAAAGPLCGRRSPGPIAGRQPDRWLADAGRSLWPVPPGASTGYQADLHAELLRALARHVDAGDDPRFIAAAQVPSAQVRIETLRAWAARNPRLACRARSSICGATTTRGSAPRR